MSRLRPHSPTKFFRLAVALLAVVQFVAPTWHVCSMGGFQPPCHETATPADKQDSSEAELKSPFKCHCEKTSPNAAKLSPDQPDCDDCGGTCLARLLLGMPGSIISPIHLFIVVAPRVAIAHPAARLVSAPSLPQPPARGPPPSSV